MGELSSTEQIEFLQPGEDNPNSPHGWSICANGTLALFGSAVLYSCQPGNDFNYLYFMGPNIGCWEVSVETITCICTNCDSASSTTVSTSGSAAVTITANVSIPVPTTSVSAPLATPSKSAPPLHGHNFSAEIGLGVGVPVGAAFLVLVTLALYRWYRRHSQLSAEKTTTSQTEVEAKELDADNKDETTAQKLKKDDAVNPQEMSGEEVPTFSRELEGSEGPARHELP